MKRIMMMVALAAFLVAALSVSALSAFAAPKACEPGDPGCKTETTGPRHSGNSSADFSTTTTETQRGNTNAKGTESTETETTVCRGPSGKVLDPGHPQCS
jgi:hypothetical protein